MKQNDGWINALFSLVFIAAPALIIFYFLLPGWTGHEVVSYGIIWLVAISFFVYVGILSWLLIHFKWLAIDSLNFNVPISLALMTILVTYPLPFWAMGVLVVIAVLLAFPVNIAVTKYKEKKIIKLRRTYKNK